MDIKVPQLAEGVDKAAVISIFVAEGDQVEAGQDLIELETDKATAAVPAEQSGVVSKILVSEGEEVRVGQSLISFGGSSSGAASKESEPSQEPEPQAAPAQQEAAPSQQAAKPVQAPTVDASTVQANEKLVQAGLSMPASPTVKMIAKQIGIDLREVPSNNPGGRIGVDELKNYILGLKQKASTPAPASSQDSTPAKPALAPLPDFSKFGSIRVEKMTMLRKKISEKMTESWTTVPHVTQYDEADVSSLAKIAKKYAPEYEKKGAKLTLTILIIKAIIGTLKKYPAFNASLDLANENIIYKDYINLGIAVDTEQGLIVPVIKNADQKSALDLAGELRKLAEKTRSRKIGMDDLQGGSFTISNQGGIGGGAFTPIINVPEVAILGLARAVEKPVVKKGKVEISKVMPFSVSYDHRVIDGGSAARFVTDLVNSIENFDEKELKL